MNNLTAQQRDILAGLALGDSAATVADRLYLDAAAIKAEIAALKRLAGATNTAALLYAWGYECGQAAR